MYLACDDDSTAHCSIYLVTFNPGAPTFISCALARTDATLSSNRRREQGVHVNSTLANPNTEFGAGVRLMVKTLVGSPLPHQRVWIRSLALALDLDSW